MSESPKKLTPAEALARVKAGEHVEFAECPHCGEPIAIYLPNYAKLAEMPPTPEAKSVEPR